MIVYDGAPAPAPDPYQDALDELDRQRWNMERAETVYSECRQRYTRAWYRVLAFEGAEIERGN